MGNEHILKDTDFLVSQTDEKGKILFANEDFVITSYSIHYTKLYDLMEEGSVQVGDYVLLHIGFIMNKIDEEDALESLRVYQEILEKLDEEERRQMVLDDDNCPNREES